MLRGKERKKRKKRERENSTELQKPNIEAEVYDNKKCNWEKKKKLKSLIGFLSAKKIDNYNRGRNGAGRGDGNPKQSTEQIKK